MESNSEIRISVIVTIMMSALGRLRHSVLYVKNKKAKESKQFLQDSYQVDVTTNAIYSILRKDKAPEEKENNVVEKKGRKAKDKSTYSDKITEIKNLLDECDVLYVESVDSIRRTLIKKCDELKKAKNK